jgi:hypothetical protein
MKAYGVSGQNKSILQFSVSVGLVDELIVSGHDQQAILRPRLRNLQWHDALNRVLVVVEIGEEILKADF